MNKSSNLTEKRKYPRVLINTPLNFKGPEESMQSPGLIINASETGLLIQTFKDIPIGKKVIIEVLFPKGVKTAKLNAIAEIIWKDIYLLDDWEEYQYGLKFIQISDEDDAKLRQILSSQSNLEEVIFADEFHRKERLVVRTKFL
jgi:hypothetical protein